MTERGKNALAIVLMLAVAGVLLFAGWRLTGSDFVVRDCSFDEQSWFEGQRTGDAGERYDDMNAVAEDLVKCDDLVYGKSVSEVRDLLGPPDSTVDAQRTWHYDIGIPPPNSDYPGLVIQYSENGAVTSVEIPGFFER